MAFDHSNHDSNTDRDRSDLSTAEEIRGQVDALGDQYLESLRLGMKTDAGQLVAAHPHLKPYLEARIHILEAVLKATQPAAGESFSGEDRVVNRANVDETNRPPVESELSDFCQELEGNSTEHYVDVRIERTTTIGTTSCPSCGGPVSLGESPEKEVTCESCGSTLRFDRKSGRHIIDMPVPSTLGRFPVTRRIGQGAFGAVYLAVDPTLSRPVAIKVPRRGFFQSRSEEQRFIREARSASSLRHANIVQVHEISDDPDEPFIVSEFVDGMTLSELNRKTKISFRESAEFLVQITGAIDYAHRNNIIHRDLKPGNILVNQARNLFVADFGLARRDDLETSMTMDGVVMGTPAYMSPEQASGLQGPVDSRTDIYSLGVILYRLLCRELPFHGTKRMMMHQVIHDEPPAPRRLNDRIPRDLETITLKAMAKVPSARFQTAGEMRDELNRWLRGEPIQSRPIGSLTRGWRWCQRHPGTATLATTIAMLLIVGAVGSLIWGKYSDGLRKKADNNAQIANANRAESDSRLFRMHQHSGLFALDRNDLLRSAFWFTNALEFDDQPINRIQIGMIEDRIPKLVNLWALESSIATLKFNESGSRVAVATLNGQVVVFDTSNGEQLLDLKTDGLAAYELKITPSGDYIAFNASSNNVELWDVDSGERRASLPHPQTVRSIDVDSDDLIVTGCQDSHVRVWKRSTQALKAEFEVEGQPVVQTRFLPNTKWVSVESRDDAGGTYHTQLWNHETKQVGQSILHRQRGLPMDLSRDGKQVVAAAWGGNLVRVLDFETGAPVGKDVILPNRAVKVFFTDAADEIVTIDINGDVSTWDVNAGSRTHSNFRSNGDPRLASTDQDRQIIALPDRKGTVKMIWRTTGVEACSSLNNGSRITAVEVLGEGRQIAIGSVEGLVQIWDLAGAVPRSRVLPHQQEVRDGAFSNDGKRCLTVSTDGKARIWDVATGKLVGQPLEHKDGIYASDLSSDGLVFATGSRDQVAKIWDAQTGKQLGNDLAHPSPVIQVAISPAGEFLLTGCFDGTVTCWEFAEDRTIREQPRFRVQHDAKITRVVIDRAGKLVASSSLDGMIRCWDAKTGEQAYAPMQHGTMAYDCDFLPNGERMVSCGNNDRVYVWDLAKAEVEQQMPCGGYVQSVIACDDGRVLSNGIPGVAHVWQEKDGRFELQASARNEAFAVSCDSQLHPQLGILAAGGGWLGLDQQMGNRGAAILWDVYNDVPFCPELFHFGKVSKVIFSPKGEELLTVSTDRTARIWSLPSNDLPVPDALRIAGLYSQTERDAGNRVGSMPPARQAREFAELSRKYPSRFSCNAEEIQRWDAQRSRVGDVK